MFSDEFLEALGSWQRGWREVQATRERLAADLVQEAAKLPVEFRTVELPCYRKRFLHTGELFEIIMVNSKREGPTSWTVCQKYAENFKGLDRKDAVSAAIFEHSPAPQEVILNICALWESKAFQHDAERFRENGGTNAEAILHFKASQGEVILDAPLHGSEIVALTGASSPFDELCDQIGLPESERDEYFKKLVDLDVYPEVLRYTSREGTQRVIQNTVRIMEEKIAMATSGSGSASGT